MAKGIKVKKVTLDLSGEDIIANNVPIEAVKGGSMIVKLGRALVEKLTIEELIERFDLTKEQIAIIKERYKK